MLSLPLGTAWVVLILVFVAALARADAPTVAPGSERIDEPPTLSIAASMHAGAADDLSIAAVQGVAGAAHRTRVGAFFRSMLVPGYGQLHNGQPLKAGLFFGAEVVLLSSALALHLAGDNLSVSYARQTQQGTDPTGRTQQLYDAAQARFRMRDSMLLAATGIWVLNMIDAFLCGGCGPATAEAEPAGPMIAPLAAIRPGAAILGLQGRF